MVGTPHLQPAPSPSYCSCVRAVTRQAAAESVSASLDLMFGLRGQGGYVVADHQWLQVTLLWLRKSS